jgi:mutator protein MutT
MKDSIKKRAVTVLLHNEDGDILAVSRKTDLNDFGLPGGKVDEGETDEQAIVREVKEETGLTLFNLKPYFIREDGEYVCTTFIGNYTGEIETAEKGKVKWTDFKEIQRGSFGAYNEQLEEYFNSFHKYESGDLVLNIGTGEAFMILTTVPAGNNAGSGYLVRAFCSEIGHAFVKKTAIDNFKMTIIKKKDDYSFPAEDDGIGDYRFHACSAHFDVNQYYKHSDEVDAFYSYHLKRVVDVGRRFKHEIPTEDWKYVEGGLWNHDCIEDARKTFNDVKKRCGEIVALISFALSNSTGKNRDERADSIYYDKIRKTKYATFAKLCDRIANIEHGIKHGSSMTNKYKAEHEHFKKELYVSGQYESMWKHIYDILK